MSGILRLANTGAGTGRSTLQSNASNDVTFNLPDTGTDNTATILTSDLHSITSVNWDGMTINITNADFNVDSGTLFVDESTNRVGIGTNSPVNKLEVKGGGIAITNAGSDHGTYGAIFAEATGHLNLAGFNINLNTGTNSNRTTSVTVDQNGKVGIGNDSPQALLHVGSDISFIDSGENVIFSTSSTHQRLVLTGGDTHVKDIQFRNSSDTALKGVVRYDGNENMRFYTDGTEQARIDGSGNVGIGTTAPTEQLTIGNGTTSNVYLRINSQNNTDSGIKFYGDLSGTKGYLTGYRGNGNLFFIQSDNAGTLTDRLVINDSGIIGIGTPTPQAKLDVRDGNLYLMPTGILPWQSDATTQNSGIFFGDAGRINIYRLSNEGSDPFNILDVDVTTGTRTSRFVIKGSGNVGIGTSTPTALLHLVANAPYITFEDVDNNQAWQLQATAWFALRNQSTSSELLRVTADGKVGIGTATPQAKLQVKVDNLDGITIENTNTAQFSSARIHLHSAGSAAGDYAMTGLVHGNENTGGSESYFAIEAKNSSATYKQTAAKHEWSTRKWVFNTNVNGTLTLINGRATVGGGAGEQADTTFAVRGTAPGSDSTNIYLIRQFSTIPATVTGTAFAFNSNSYVASGATLSNYIHYAATTGNFNGSTITNHVGLNIGALTGSTNTYAIKSEVASGTNKWNLYISGTAGNYFAGHALFHTTTESSITTGAANAKGFFNSCVLRSSRAATSELIHYEFYNPNGSVGSIKTSGSQTIFEETSDYRLKENIKPLTGAADLLKALKPCVYNFKADPNTTIQGFIAHEAQEVCPQAVTGTKDAMEGIGTLTEWDGTVLEIEVTEPESLTWEENSTDDEGITTTNVRTRTWVRTGDRPTMQGIDKSKLVPLLTAALQESLKKIEALEARLNAAGIA